jgi:hypothetical protein
MAIVTRDEADLIFDSADEDTMSSSIARMSNDELHKEIVQTYVALGENCIMYKALVLDARRRMAAGEKVGGYTTWGEYADLYLKRIDESLPTCLRRLRRELEGVNPDTKHRNKRKKGQSNAEIVEAGRDRQTASEVRQARDRGFEEGRAAEKKARAILANKAAKSMPPSATPALDAVPVVVVPTENDNQELKEYKLIAARNVQALEIADELLPLLFHASDAKQHSQIMKYMKLRNIPLSSIPTLRKVGTV